MTRIPLILLFLIFALIFASAQTKSMSWDDSTRDVYIDGQIDREAQVLFPDNDNQMALVSPKLKQAVVLDKNSHIVGVIDKNAFKFSADRATAKTDSSLSPKTVGNYVNINDVYSFAVDGKAILINRHEGALGEITEEQLWQTVPVWHALMEDYKPNPDAVAALKSVDQDTQLTVIFGTWCHDSKNQVPRLMRALELSNNKKFHIKLVALDHGFGKSVQAVERYHVTNTPTIIVEQNGREIGRINETPAVPLIEDDLVAILRGKPNVHHGSSDHGAQLASGSYQYRDRDGKESGTEKWELYSTNRDGRWLHSEITKGDLRTDVYYETDAKKQPVFIEITLRQGNHIIRERSYTDDHKLHNRIAGDAGVLDQTTDFPDNSVFLSPAIASEGWGWSANAKDGAKVPVYYALSNFDNLGAFVDTVDYENKGEETVHTTSGDFHAERIIEKTRKESRQLYIDSRLGIPVTGDTKDGGTFALTSFQLSSGTK